MHKGYYYSYIFVKITITYSYCRNITCSYFLQNLQTFLDSATKGVVYFSLGALQEPENLAPSILSTLADAFREVPYTVLWKIGNVTMINKSDNVFAQIWFPQQEILGELKLDLTMKPQLS